MAKAGSGAILDATVLPMERPDMRAEALLYADGRIVLVGSNAAVRGRAEELGITPTSRAGRLVLPGFVDAHMHFLHVGVKTMRPDLREATSRRDALSRLAAWLRAHPGTTPVTGEGWDESDWPDGAPVRADLDRILADVGQARPLVLRRICGHIAVASTQALPIIRTRWDDERVDEESGLLLEEPSLYLNEVLPAAATELDAALRISCQEAARLGVTSLGDYSQAPFRAALQRAAAAGHLTVRVASSIYIGQWQQERTSGFRTGRRGVGPTAPPGHEERVHGEGTTGAGQGGVVLPDGHTGVTPGRAGGTSTFLQDGALKLFLDGSFGGHTAWLREPYEGEAASGRAIWQDDPLFATVLEAHEAGVQVHMHAIGDAAIDQALRTYSRVEQEADRPWTHNLLRHRIEHCELLHTTQIQEMARLDIVASCQPNFAGPWQTPGHMYEHRLGKRLRLANRFGDLLRAHVPVAFGSDGMPFGPLIGVKAAVHHPEASQRLAPEMALWLYTRAAARSLHLSSGLLREGHPADLVILDGALDDVDSLRVEETIVDGRTVWSAASL